MIRQHSRGKGRGVEGRAVTGVVLSTVLLIGAVVFILVVGMKK
jgi:hypothetical protein